MKIAVFGDSFADIAPQNRINQFNMPWILWIEKYSSYKVCSFGQSGTNIWFSYKKFLKHYLSFDIIIFCYSNYERWLNINKYPGYEWIIDEQVLLLSGPEKKDERELCETLVNIRSHIHDSELNRFVYQNVFDSINKFCFENGKKIINLLSFEECLNPKLNIDVSKSTGSVLTNIISIAKEETKSAQQINVDKKILEKIISNDFRFCHLNNHNNKVLAKIMLECLEDTKKYYNLKTDNRWSFDIKHWSI